MNIIADREKRDERISICKGCPELKGILALRCSVCGCFIKAKVIIFNEKCPKGKW